MFETPEMVEYHNLYDGFTIETDLEKRLEIIEAVIGYLSSLPGDTPMYGYMKDSYVTAGIMLDTANVEKNLVESTLAFYSK